MSDKVLIIKEDEPLFAVKKRDMCKGFKAPTRLFSSKQYKDCYEYVLAVEKQARKNGTYPFLSERGGILQFLDCDSIFYTIERLGVSERDYLNLKVDGFNPEWACCANCKLFAKNKCACTYYDVSFKDYCTCYSGDGVLPEYPNSRPAPTFNIGELHYLRSRVESDFWHSDERADMLNKLDKMLRA